MKFEKLILHIGVHKTGTTAIQNFLSINKDELNSQGYFIPAFSYGEENEKTQLRFSIVKKEERKTREILKTMINQARSLSCDTIIISDENYCKISEIDFNNINIFLDFFEQIEVLMYCRRQDRELESRYAFRVMWEGAKLNQSPQQWFKEYKGRDYFEIAEFYRRNIVGCNMKVVSYDLNAKNLIASFINVCRMKDQDYALPKKSQSNISANKYIVEIMSEINKYILSDKLFLEIKEYVLNHKQLKKGPKAIFYTDENRLECNEIFEQSTKKLVKDYNCSDNLFDELTHIQVPKGLEDKFKKTIIDEIVTIFNLKYERRCEVLLSFERKLKIGISCTNIDIYREISLLCEALALYNTAYRFMSFAKFFRPDGPLINAKIEFFERKINLVSRDKLLENYDSNIIFENMEEIHLEDNTIKQEIKDFREKLNISRLVSKYRIYYEIALICDWYNEIEAAHCFMKLVKKRPGFKLINQNNMEI